MGTGEKGDVVIDLSEEAPSVIVTGDVARELASLIKELPEPDEVPCAAEDVPEPSDYIRDRAGNLVSRLNQLSVTIQSQTDVA